MNLAMMKRLGNIEQVCSVRQARLENGPGDGIHVAEFTNAAGLHFTVVPDRCMDIYDMSFCGINMSFMSRNGLRSPMSYTPQKGEFTWQWAGGMLVTCGLDNVGGHCEEGGQTRPTHGRIGSIPARNFGVETRWEGYQYVMRAKGEVHEANMYGQHLVLNRTIETSMYDTSVKIRDTITNMDCKPEPYMLLYHCNFGYPLLQENSCVYVTPSLIEPLNEISLNPGLICEPIDGRGEELYLGHVQSNVACLMVVNEELDMAGYVKFDPKYLPRFLEWKMMKSHDYVLALEPCNTWSIDRSKAIEENKIATLDSYSSIETTLEIGVVDGYKTVMNTIQKNNMTLAKVFKKSEQ